MLEISCAIVGEDEEAHMNAMLDQIAARLPAPVLICSTDLDVIEEALKRIPGKPLIHCINLEGGEERASDLLGMARRYGAAVVVMTIDEDGMALTAERKLAVARRVYRLATEKHGLRPQDLIFDPLTLPISTGRQKDRTAGMETLQAVRLLKQEWPACATILGISNISMGLESHSRRVLNIVFLKEAVNCGLDIAIVDSCQIDPLEKISAREVELARKLIFCDSSEGDPLQVYTDYFAARPS